MGTAGDALTPSVPLSRDLCFLLPEKSDLVAPEAQLQGASSLGPGAGVRLGTRVPVDFRGHRGDRHRDLMTMIPSRWPRA